MWSINSPSDCTPTWPKCGRSALRLQWKLLLKPTGAKYRTTRLLFKLVYQGGSSFNLPWTWEYRGVHPCAALRLQLHHSTACTLRLARGSTLSLTSDQLVPSGGVHQARCLNCATRPFFVYTWEIVERQWGFFCSAIVTINFNIIIIWKCFFLKACSDICVMKCHIKLL